MGPQTQALRRGVHLVVACPGRLLDHLGQGVRLDRLEFLVLDEADRMLDMGFLPDIKRILARIPSQRQTLFFSATLPPEVKGLATSLLKHPELIQTERQAPPAMVAQSLMPVAGNRKADLLAALLTRPELDQAIVFTRTKARANRLCEVLVKRGIKAQRIHGNRSQSQRTEALAGFHSKKYRVLVATDLASRGIDVEALGHVVNFDVPVAPDDYIHWVGRTGRAGFSGTAWTLVSPEEESLVRDIERKVGKRLPRELIPGFSAHDAPPPGGDPIPPVRDRRFPHGSAAYGVPSQRRGGQQSYDGGHRHPRRGQGPGAHPGQGPSGSKPHGHGGPQRPGHKPH